MFVLINNPIAMKLPLLSFLGLLFTCFSMLGQIPSDTVTLDTGTGVLEGTLLSPPSDHPVPVALIIAGSGPTDRNGNNAMMVNHSLKMLAEGLSEAGIASLRYDKRGIGASAGAASSEAELRFEHYVEDARAWVEKLRNDDRFDEVWIIGHSEGSLIGMAAAQAEPIDGFISLAGAGLPAGQVLRRQLSAQAPAVLEPSLAIIEQLEAGDTVADVPPMLASLFRPSVQPYLISWFRYDPRKLIAALDCPVLIVQGSTDLQVTEEDANQLAEAQPAAESLLIDGMNHVLKEVTIDRLPNLQTYNMPELPLKAELMPGMVAFIKRT